MGYPMDLAPDRRSFAFEHATLRLTVRRETRGGSEYWYAYHKHAGRLHKTYVGRLDDVAPERLEAAAERLAAKVRTLAPTHLGSAPAEVPQGLTHFVGREQAVAQVSALLRTTRLLTLLGPGGVGKSRLGFEAVRLVKRRFPDGIAVVQLAPVTDSRVLPYAVAAALGVPEPASDDTLETLAQATRARRMLLVLDNCEHLVGACAELAQALLEQSTVLRILATSRHVLGVTGETTWAVPPLSLPVDSPMPNVESIAQSEAVQLFVDRARAARPEFRLNSDNAPAVVAICRRMDGLPLAIELAAARIRAFNARQIADRLDQSLQLLVAGPRVAAERHRTMRATLDWSDRLLTDAERRLLARASIFAGGWTLDALEALNADADTIPDEVPEVLAQLVDKSLVIVEPHVTRTRYRLLEPVRQYASERLEHNGERAALELRHAEHFATWVEAVCMQMGPDRRDLVERLEHEHDNIRKALQTLLNQRDAARVQRLAGILAPFWVERGHVAEGRMWLDRALALPSDVQLHARSMALLGAGQLATTQCDYADSRRFLDAALAASRQLKNRQLELSVLVRLAQHAWVFHEFEPARRLAEQVLHLAERLVNPFAAAIAHWLVAQVAADLGDASADRLAEVARAQNARIGHTIGLGLSLTTVGQIRLMRNDLIGARNSLEEALHTYGSAASMPRLWTLLVLGWVTIQQADLVPARAALAEATLLAWERISRRRIVVPLEGFAQLAAAAGRPESALRLAGAAETLRRGYIGPKPIEAATLQLWLDRATAEVRPRLAAELRRQGQMLSPEEALAEALGLEVSAVPKRSPLLTPREQQVAQLVGAGLSSRDIAHQLVISDGTVRAHMEHIFHKLDLHSRAQLAAWASRQFR